MGWLGLTWLMVLPLGRNWAGGWVGPLRSTGVTLSGPNFDGDMGPAEVTATVAGDMDSEPTLMTLVGQIGAEGVDVAVTIS